MTDKKLMRLVGQRLRQLRTERDMTQEDMTDFGFDYRYYQRIESGERNVTLKTLNKLASAFKVPIKNLFPYE